MRSAHRKAARAKRQYTADPLAMHRAFARTTTFTAAEQTALNLPLRIAFQAFIDSKATEPDFHTLAAAVNISLVCAERIDPLVEQSCLLARDALLRINARHERTGLWGLDGPARGEIEQAVDIYEQLNSLLTGGQLKNAMAECMRRMEAQAKETA